MNHNSEQKGILNLNRPQSARFTISALTRWADGQCVPLYILQRGDGERGLVLIHAMVGDDQSHIWVQGFDGAGPCWRQRFPGPVSRDQAQAYMDRERARDDDLWVIELENCPNLPPVLRQEKNG